MLVYGLCLCCVLDITAMNYNVMYPWAKKNLLNETSFYTTRERIRNLRKSGRSFGKRHDRFIRIAKCKEDEPVCCNESLDPEGPLCFFYATLFKKFLLHIRLSIFEKKLLIELNVAPAQLHPNSWAFTPLLFCVHNSTFFRL